jgi:glycosyltransferase involved in cell wall biosynthesis
MSKVSIIVPIYNAGNKLNKCISSIINQTYKDIEIILVNDGSTDNCLTICNKFKNKDSRITVINKENEGSVKTRKRGVEKSTSPYIMFVDADDWIDHKAVEIMYMEAINNELDIVVCNMYKSISAIKRPVASSFFN